MTPEQKRRYARHLVLPEIGEAGQAKLAQAKVLVVGAGGLGSTAAGYLCAMGVGGIGLNDHDRVELSNLQRQVLYETADAGRLKVEAARDRLEEINPEVRVTTIAERLDEDSARATVRGYDLVIDGAANFATRFALHDACYAEKKTLVLAAISGFSAQLSTFKAYLGAPHPCYRCFVGAQPERELTCAQEGIIGALAGVMGSLQALEAVKELLCIGDSLSGHILMYDALAGSFRKVLLKRDKQCATCGRSYSQLAC